MITSKGSSAFYCVGWLRSISISSSCGGSKFRFDPRFTSCGYLAPCIYYCGWGQSPQAASYSGGCSSSSNYCWSFCSSSCSSSWFGNGPFLGWPSPKNQTMLQQQMELQVRDPHLVALHLTAYSIEPRIALSKNHFPSLGFQNTQ